MAHPKGCSWAGTDLDPAGLVGRVEVPVDIPAKIPKATDCADQAVSPKATKQHQATNGHQDHLIPPISPAQIKGE